MVDNIIKKADLDYFVKDLSVKKNIENKKNIILKILGDNIQDINNALDLSNDKLPLDIEKKQTNLYYYKREIPIKFNNVRDLILFVQNNQFATLDLKAFGLENTIIKNTSIDIKEDIFLAYNYDIDPFFAIACIISVFGLPILICSIYDQNKIKKYVKNGLTITISGYFMYNN
jgi:hypothetical protein